MANQNYEAIRVANGPGMAALGLGGIGILLVGVIIFLHEAFGRRGAAATGQDTKPRASGRARVITSLIGFAFGATASFYMFLSAAARFIETEKAEIFVRGGVTIAFVLAALSLLVGFVGIFLRGYALGRVPAYFLLGGVITFAAVRIFGINMLEWTQFVTLLQG